MILLRMLLAIVGLGIIVVAIISFFSGLFDELGGCLGIIGAAIVFFVLGRDSVCEFLGITNSLLDGIVFGAMVGGAVLSAMDVGKIGGAVLAAGWVAVGMILLQVIPIPFIANIVEIISIPFTIACIPLLLIILIFV